MRVLTLLFVFAAAACPQSLSVGVKGGAPLGEAFKIVSNAAAGRSYFQDTKRYTFGPMIDVRLPFGLGIELDALYKGLEYGYTGTSGGLKLSSLTKGRAWEFPLIAKYRSPGILARPYAGLGVSFRRFQGLKQFITKDIPGLLGAKTDTGTPEELNDTFTKGVIFTGGVEIKVMKVRISPELRYTRWVNHGFRDLLNVFGSNQNQIEALVGLTF